MPTVSACCVLSGVSNGVISACVLSRNIACPRPAFVTPREYGSKGCSGLQVARVGTRHPISPTARQSSIGRTEASKHGETSVNGDRGFWTALEDLRPLDHELQVEMPQLSSTSKITLLMPHGQVPRPPRHIPTTALPRNPRVHSYGCTAHHCQDSRAPA